MNSAATMDTAQNKGRIEDKSTFGTSDGAITTIY